MANFFPPCLSLLTLLSHSFIGVNVSQHNHLAELERMGLDALSVDVLALILKDDLSWAAIELWKSGCRPLMAKLANGAVQEMRLQDGRREGWQVKWPRCLAHFKLRFLSFKALYLPFENPSLVHHELKKLNGRLITLEVSFQGATEAFFPPLPSAALSGDDWHAPY